MEVESDDDEDEELEEEEGSPPCRAARFSLLFFFFLFFLALRFRFLSCFLRFRRSRLFFLRRRSFRAPPSKAFLARGLLRSLLRSLPALLERGTKPGIVPPRALGPGALLLSSPICSAMLSASEI